jgi:5-formyltetrahydrofolate cyclo-ligase
MDGKMTHRPGIASPEEDPNAEILCASPPCFMHELDPSWLGLQSWEQVRAWRRTERAALIARRVAVPVAARLERDDAITVHVRAAVPDLARRHVGFYWPFKGEYDPRPLARALHREGARLALPMVATKGRPLIFRAWRPGTRMMQGVWNIPIPAEGEEVTPDTLLVPLVGFDARGYRLGYGGGYYDRTLATMAPRPVAIGIGFENGRLATIHPQPHDVRMDLTVTEAGATGIGAGSGPAEPTP